MHRKLTRAHIFKEQALQSVERFLHIEAMSGVVLLCAAFVALLWANSSGSHGYEALLAMKFGVSIGSFALSWPLHFWVNDVLMSVFFLVAGMEIRREMHQGALSNWRQAALPVIAAAGGVMVPALIYLALNGEGARSQGWAVPTATDIAFAVGILALLGRAIPANLRVVLLSLAIIDDVIAVAIIALFYSQGLNLHGIFIAMSGLFLVFFFQFAGFSRPFIYVLPGAILWWGLWQAGIHPSLVGVILGLATPVLPPRTDTPPLQRLTHALHMLRGCQAMDEDILTRALRDISRGQRDMLAPVTRVQQLLHPWVAFGVMPIFAFANAGVTLHDINLADNGAYFVFCGVGLGLFLGKPIGVLAASFIAVKLKLCQLPPQLDWTGIILIGLLAGIGFTMAIFVAMLAFVDINHLAAAKLGVLSGSCLSALLGLGFGLFYRAKKHQMD